MVAATCICRVQDVDYVVEGDRTIVRIFGRDTRGKLVCLRYDTARPYFFAQLKQHADIREAKEKIRTTQKDGHYVLEVEEVTKLQEQQEVPLLKISCNIPRAVPPLQEVIREFSFIHMTYEYNIVFAQRFLLDRGIAPLTLVSAKVTDAKKQYSYAKTFDCSELQSITEEESAKSVELKTTEEKPLSVCAVDIEVYNPEGKHVDPKKHPIVMIALATPEKKTVLTWKKTGFKGEEILENERAMIERCAELLNIWDTDIILGYYSDGFDFPYIMKRAHELGMHWNANVDGTEPTLSTGMTTQVKIRGRTHVDILRFIKNVYGKSMRTDSYTLEAVAQEILGEGKSPVNLNDLARAWDENDITALATFAEYNLKDAELTLRLMNILLPNIVELMKLVRQPLFDIIRLSYSRLVEWYVIAQAVKENRLIPNKPTGSVAQQRGEEQAKGAFVFEPTPGLYEDIAVFDFRSLYPSIIASHNISVGTVHEKKQADDDEKVPIENKTLYITKSYRGFLSRIIEEIITTRATIKEQLKETKKSNDKNHDLLLARSYGLKILANAFYGYLGFAQARWYSHNCVEAVTAFGRNYIRQVISNAEEKGFRVVYSDTDSVFLQLKGKTLDDARTFAAYVNKDLPGLMELEFENLYATGIFVATRQDGAGAKKRYALMDQNGKLKIMGFEFVRRNFSPIGKRIQYEVLKTLLHDRDPQKAVAYVRKELAQLDAHKLPVSDLVIHTKITKPIHHYTSEGPNVAAAKRLIARGDQISPGVPFDYVVIGGGGKIRDRVRLADEPEAKRYDATYYTEHQILPAITKIFDVVGISIEETLAPHKQGTLNQFF